MMVSVIDATAPENRPPARPPTCCVTSRPDAGRHRAH
jgi:hypothetical protein